MSFVRLCHRFLARQTMPSAAVGYYERMSDGVVGFYLKPFADEVNKVFGKGARILDVGTGTGHLPVLLAQENESHCITGLDLSQACLDVARRRACREGVGDRVRFLKAEVSDVGDRFDLVVSTCSLHHWRFPAQVLRCMASVLTESGQIWLLDDSGDVTEEDRRAWIERVEASFDAGWLFRNVFRFESRFLAYTEEEIRRLCGKAGLEVYDFRIRDVFLSAKCARRK